jgi:hypothetical protein
MVSDFTLKTIMKNNNEQRNEVLSDIGKSRALQASLFFKN